MAMIVPSPVVIRNEDYAILTSWVSVQALGSGLDIVGSSMSSNKEIKSTFASIASARPRSWPSRAG